LTNNVAEYRALLRALEEAKAMGAGAVEVRSDSDLLVSQLQGSYKVKSPDLGPLYLDAIRLLRGFSRYTVTKIPRGQNAAADALANHAIEQAFPESTLEFSAIVEKEDKLYVAPDPAFGVTGYAATRDEALETGRVAVIVRIASLTTPGHGFPTLD